ncbi:hypothetical protein [Streptomyces sp. NL15-2K]|uniref:hypothetical protein n=1 Tax=Streptomyces sp. NL15-2K TaxID=376149 RepID=UPI000F570951|nr:MULTISPECIES: hypothetical protein [Actinomycetes]WKX12084.1 hypothetical protein Q4V64_33045 [Kutzneria buriramensis]GCB46424.1 hypothetical protein SNL152K_3722 [Streptomyces sp. NL15-2K]
MTTQPDHGGQDLIPRPERTPEAVRTALARVAPHRLGDMERHKEQALATAIQDGKIGHLQAWLTHWHAQVEIERRPDLAVRHRAALTTVHGTTGKDDPAFRHAMNELAAVEDEAVRAVSA